MIYNESHENKDLARYNLILNHPDYQEYLKKNEAAELNRSFCHHDLPHFLDVARIAYIMNLEQKLGYSKDIIYAIALLHDIGRWKQYTQNIPHDAASVELADPILIECNYQEEERKLILDAILSHRSLGVDENGLKEIIYKADKASRACFHCKASPDCNWSQEKKNLEIKY
ncbi:MAG: superfamily hydrolase [Herbinix sp.]|jgi:uncharacterized protein|nr:superfamily hydrolase [Herbinix sp.]